MTRERKIVFIINPIAGVKGRKRLEKLLDRFFLGKDVIISKYYTGHQGHGFELAQQAIKGKPEIVVAAGGDGTINEVASALINTDVVLGIIPLGSGNGFARHLKIPLNIEKALKLLLSGSQISADVAYLNGKAFFCTSGIGFDAEVAHYYKDYKRRGLLAYALSFVRVFWGYRSKNYQVEIDGESFHFNAVFLSIANISQFGYNFQIAPQASVRDGLLDVVVVKHFPKWKILSIVMSSFSGSLNKSRYVWHRQAKNVKILQPIDDKFIHIDGEAEIRNGELVYHIENANLRVVVKDKE